MGLVPSEWLSVPARCATGVYTAISPLDSLCLLAFKHVPNGFKWIQMDSNRTLLMLNCSYRGFVPITFLNFNKGKTGSTSTGHADLI